MNPALNIEPKERVMQDLPYPRLDEDYPRRLEEERAIIAVAPAIMVSAFHRLSRQEPYRERGAHYVDERRRQFTVDRLTRRLEHLGYRVHLEPGAAPSV
jgi:hypothetical protein